MDVAFSSGSGDNRSNGRNNGHNGISRSNGSKEFVNEVKEISRTSSSAPPSPLLARSPSSASLHLSAPRGRHCSSSGHSHHPQSAPASICICFAYPEQPPVVCGPLSDRHQVYADKAFLPQPSRPFPLSPPPSLSS